MEWIDISVFISSTFNDMHAERDLLLKKVFPVLSEWCAQRRIRLYDIDLRWGVSEEQSRNRNTVEVCLRNIDECRPFFLCFLGQRRGWIPSKEKINPDTYLHYPEIAELIGKHSVTEVEIEHALLAPMIHMVEGRSIKPQASVHSLFFIRDGGYVLNLNDGQKHFFTNIDCEDVSQTDAQQASFIARVRREWDGVYDYSCRFDKDLYSYELKDFGEDCAQGRLTDFYINEVPMEQVILEALKAEILKEYPERAEVIDNIEESESDRQEKRVQDMVRGSIERPQIAGRIASYCDCPGNKVFILYGKAGSGKSTLLSKLFCDCRSRYDHSIIRFCATTSQSSCWKDMWIGIAEELGIEGAYDTASKIGLLSLMEEISRMGNALIILDGIDELQEGLSVLSAVPGILPDGVKLIVSLRSDREAAETLLENARLSKAAILCGVEPLSENREIESLISAYLAQYLKALDDDQIQAICDSPCSGNPLFLKIILRELRVFGSYGQIGQQIKGYGQTPVSAFHKVLEDLESEINYNPIPARDFVPQMVGILSLVRGSIPRNILKLVLAALLKANGTEISDTIAFYLRRLGPYFSWDGERLGISYASFKEAAQGRYVELSKQHHITLAMVLRDYDPIESLYHYRMAGMTQEIYRLSEDVSFLIDAIGKSGATRLLAELESAALMSSDSVSKEILECLRKVAVVTGRDTQLAAALFYKELENPGYRDKARALCRSPWIRYERLCTDTPMDSETGSFQTLFSVDNPGCQDFAAAKAAGFVYLLGGERDVVVCNLNDGTERAQFSLEGNGRIRKLESSADGSLLAAVWEDLTVTVNTISLDENLCLIMLTCVVTDKCSSVRFGGISLFGDGDGIVWQRPDGSIIHYHYDQALMVEQCPEGKQLTGVCDCGMVWKSGRMFSLALHSGQEIIMNDARINDAAMINGKIYIAAENKKLEVYDPITGNMLSESALSGESLISLSVCGESLYGADRYGSITRIDKSGPKCLGRITQGEDILDVNTRLINLDSGKMAFVSMQRRALISLEVARQCRRLLRVCIGRNDNAYIWDGSKDFLVVREDGEQIKLMYPQYLLAGRNVNEKNNLKIACAGETIVYEENQVGIHFITPEGMLDLPGEPSSEMGGILCDLQYEGNRDIFKGTTFRGEYLEINMDGSILTRLALPKSDSNIHILCSCGKRSAVLSRRVRKQEDQTASAYIIDVMTMIDAGRIVWRKEYAREKGSVTGMFYDMALNQLAVFHSQPFMELIDPGSGEIIKRTDFPSKNFLQGAALYNGLLYCVSTHEKGDCLTVRTVTNETIISMPSQRRIKQILSAGDAVLVQEGDETLYSIIYEA